MYCLFDASNYGYSTDLPLEIFIKKTDNSLNFNKSWSEMKFGFGGKNNFFSGLENIHKKCPDDSTCNFVILAEFMTGIDNGANPNF